MKKLLFALCIVSGCIFYVASSPGTAHAVGQSFITGNQNPSDSDFVPLAPIPGLTDGSGQGSVLSGNFGEFFNSLYQYLIGLSVALAIIWIIWGGILISTSDSIGNHARGRKKIEDAILGLALVLAPALVFSVINNSILNLSINFDAIDLTTPQQQTTTPPPTQSYGNFSSPGGTITCPSSANQGSCSDALTDSCQQAGGDPVVQGGTLTDVSVYCRPKNQNTVPPGSTITASACQDLAANPSPGATVYASMVVPQSQAENCDSPDISDMKQAGGYSYCANITGGGVCLYNQ